MSDVSLSVSEAAFKAAFNKIYPSISLPFDGSTSLGPIWIGVDAAIHIEGAGDIDFEDGNTFLLKELDIGWDKLILRLGIDLPAVKVGKFCLIRMPDDAPFLAGECIVEFPGGEIFGGAPDIGPITINLNAIIPYVVSEISGRYEISLAKDGAKLVLKADVESLDVDPISINDTFGKLPLILRGAIAAAAAQYVTSHPPAWVIDAALGLLGFPTITELILDLLDIEDDVEEWLMDVLNLSIGIDNLIYQAILDKVLAKAVFEIPDPYELVPSITADVDDYGGFPDPVPPGPKFKIEPAKADILNPSAKFDADTLHIHFDLGV
jgi:hypothetical protein